MLLGSFSHFSEKLNSFLLCCIIPCRPSRAFVQGFIRASVPGAGLHQQSVLLLAVQGKSKVTGFILLE